MADTPSAQGSSPFNEGPSRIYLASYDGQPNWLDVRQPAAEVQQLFTEPRWPTLHHLDGTPFVINPQHVVTIIALPEERTLTVTDLVW